MKLCVYKITGQEKGMIICIIFLEKPKQNANLTD